MASFDESGTGDLGPVDAIFRGADVVLSAAERLVSHRVLIDFVESVTWNEPFIIALVAAQALLLCLTVCLRRNFGAQVAIFLSLSAVVFSARLLNSLGTKHWQFFATQNYFDRQGLFMIIFVCGPLIVTANFIVMNLLLDLVRVASKSRRRGVELAEQKKTK